MKVKVSLKIMIKIGNGLLFSLPVGEKPRGVKEMKQFVFKFRQDTSASLEVERFLFFSLEQNVEKVGRVV